jgi:hypothetical protein
VGWLAARLRHLVPFTSSTFRTFNEIASAKAAAASKKGSAWFFA